MSTQSAKNGFLHAIDENAVKGVGDLLEEFDHIEGQPRSWEGLSAGTATFNFGITLLILAVHSGGYEVVKILLDRGNTLPAPPEIRGGCF